MKLLKKIIKTKDFMLIVSLYALSIYIYYVSQSFPVRPYIPRAQNPGFYPSLLSVVLIVLNTIYLIQVIIKVKKEETPKKEDDSESISKDKEKAFWGKATSQTKRYLGISLIMLFVYTFLMNWLGFASSTFIFIFVITKVLSSNEEKLYKLIIFALSVTAILYVVFDIIIRIRFPEGLLI
ncbi:MAG: tripartite tricarboxylate transporter TctB family protein [Bacillota bacterium]